MIVKGDPSIELAVLKALGLPFKNVVSAKISFGVFEVTRAEITINADYRNADPEELKKVTQKYTFTAVENIEKEDNQ